MEFITVSQYAELHNLSERTVRNWCSEGKMDGAFLSGKTWIIPADTPLPRKGKHKLSPLMKRLREEKAGRVSGGIYHRTVTFPLCGISIRYWYLQDNKSLIY